jgi:hypothetical protein
LRNFLIVQALQRQSPDRGSLGILGEKPELQLRFPVHGTSSNGPIGGKN